MTRSGDKTSRNPVQVGRVALRQEGDWWTAYYADAASMDGATELGRIKMSIVINNPRAKQAFMDLMRIVIADAMAATLGQEPEWRDPQAAPEHERSGHG